MLAIKPVHRPTAAECVTELEKLLRATMAAEGVVVEDGQGGGQGSTGGIVGTREAADLAAGDDDDDAAQAKRKRQTSTQEPEGSKKQRQASQTPVKNEKYLRQSSISTASHLIAPRKTP